MNCKNYGECRGKRRGGNSGDKDVPFKKASEDASVYRLIMMAIKSAFYNNEEYWHEEDS
ncbi:hypothetical protein SALSENF001_04500 [Salmonella enterica subsp. enterica serovar Senftenberg]|nr:hypothetical protein SL180013_04510 [Salmonella enterica subsp. enterica serovar Senftenberg]CAH2869129.1 hypothetical protein SEN012174_34700 [Salmonella enterica subsp. enterica serovar Newport]CAI9421862.1 hypothetical protein LA5775_04370 [Salmonella enterica subsp. enterica serovar Enteritidis]